MKKIFLLIGIGLLSQSSMAQTAPSFRYGSNKKYTPYRGFAVPVAQPTPLDAPVRGSISNKEKHLATRAVEGAHSGLHFPKGTEGVKTVRYDLYVTDTTVNYTGKDRPGIAVNGKLPGPTLSFTVGDTALIYVHNLADYPSGVHWHGVQLPNRMDGVPFLTQLPIPPHTTYIYKFPVVQTGTYWYHSHFGLQEQVGLYGALIFNKRTEPEIPTVPVVLSDWSDTKPREIDRMLHTGNDWFGIKKHSMQSYWEALKDGKLGAKFGNEWKRMEAMDVSDVFYEKFLLNGDTSQSLSQFRAGDSIRLRIVNGASSSYFWLSYSGGKLMVVANDGNDVEPVLVDRLIIGPSETYDVVVKIPENMKYEFLATPEDRSGEASLWLGNGMKMPAKKLPKLKYFEGMKMMNKMMKMNGDMKDMGMKMSLQKMDMNEVMYPEMNKEKHDHKSAENKKYMIQYVCPMHPDEIADHPGNCPKCGMKRVPKKKTEKEKEKEPVALSYNMLKATENTTLPKGPWKTLNFVLEGNMNRYVWSLNGKTVSESDKIKIKRGENLRIILHNNSMMRHPMHLHGHDFRLLNQYGKRSPLKNVVDIMPMETDTLEFHASESGDWFFHCHILYHMMAGMGRIFSYQDSTDNPELPHPEETYNKLKRKNNKFYMSFENDFATNGNDGSFTYENTRWGLQAEWRLGYKDESGYEVETHFGRYFGNKQWIFPYVGVDWRYRKGEPDEKNLFGQRNTSNKRAVFHAGIQYTLPWLVIADASVDHTGHLRLQLSREDIPLSPRLRASFMVNTDKEYTVGGRYILTKLLSLSTHYDSDMGWGAGVTFSY